MPLTPGRKRELLAASHALRAAAVIPAGGPTQAQLEHVRACLASRAIVKVRVAADNSEDCDTVGEALVSGVPCELVRRVGRVLILYRSDDEAGVAT